VAFLSTGADPMAETSRTPVNPLGQALGRIPSGLYILTVRNGDLTTGMLASWVQQAGFEPPMLTVAVARQRYVGDWIALAGKFTLNQLAAGSKSLIRHFGRGFAAGAPAFEGIELRDEAADAPILAGAIAYLDAEVAGEVSSGDHRIFLARVTAGAVFDDAAEPLLHVRHNGFHY
jgi:flavin reductase (DIM6/NTAB) family NADH-FMN oxidoreductase RutF